MNEEWRPIPAWPYEVSNLGHVRHLRFKKNLAIVPDRDGYPIVGFAQKHLGKAHPKQFKTHQLVALCFLGPRPDGQEVNHKDGVKTNNAIENLEYVTTKVNGRHAHQMGLCSDGEAHHSARLKRDEVREILRRHAAGETGLSLAKHFGVTKGAIYKIVNGESWKGAR